MKRWPCAAEVVEGGTAGSASLVRESHSRSLAGDAGTDSEADIVDPAERREKVYLGVVVVA